MQFDLNWNVHEMSAKFSPSFLIQINHALGSWKESLIYCVMCAIISMHHDVLHYRYSYSHFACMTAIIVIGC